MLLNAPPRRIQSCCNPDEDQGGGCPETLVAGIPDKVRKQIVDLALDQPELSPLELAVPFTKGSFKNYCFVMR